MIGPPNQDREISRRGIMLVLSSPSGAGKTTLTRNLLREEENVSLSVSVTTRPRRPSEIEGVHYFFVSQRHFEAMRDGGELLEWAEVHGDYLRHPARAGGADARAMAATCCSTSTGRAPVSCWRRCATTWSPCSCCRRRRKS